jgi:peptidoglycan/LPS O-acetylase OafA/YrhL
LGVSLFSSFVGSFFFFFFLTPRQGLVIAWMTLLCLCERAGVVGYILSARFWLPFSRLTYTAYLVHPIVLSAFFASFQQPLHFTVTMGVSYFVNVLAISYLCALGLALLIEFPFSSLDKLFSARR